MDIDESRAWIASGYPPPRHMMRDLRLSIDIGPDDSSIARAPVVPHICQDHGGVRVGIVVTLLDVLGGGLAMRSVYPDWVATSGLSIYMTEDLVSGSVAACGRVLRAGKTSVVMEMDILEEAGGHAKPVGWATMTFSRLLRRADNIVINDSQSGGAVFALDTSGLSRSFLDEAGIQIVDAPAGIVELEMTDYVRNSFRALHGGIYGALSDAAGEHAARAATGKPVVTRDLSIHYLAQGKVGPFRTRTRVIRADSISALTRVEVLDVGANERLLTVAVNGAALQPG